MIDLLEKLPAHDCELTLTHNSHKSYYETAAQWLESLSAEMYDWKDEDAKRRAIETNEIWTLQWYPNTPIGFHSVAAPTLRELLELVEGEK